MLTHPLKKIASSVTAGLNRGYTRFKFQPFSIYLFSFFPNFGLLVRSQFAKVIVLVQVKQENELLILVNVDVPVLYFQVDVVNLLDLLFEQLVHKLWQESDVHVKVAVWEHFGP